LKKTGTFFLTRDKLQLGIILALLLPLAIFLIIYYGRFSYYSFSEFLYVIKTESRLLTFLAAWCLVANIGLFTIYINSGKYQTAKGVFGVTVVYGIVFLLLKLIM
jgi:hypothetical protein